jgi:hypothetical protein
MIFLEQWHASCEISSRPCEGNTSIPLPFRSIWTTQADLRLSASCIRFFGFSVHNSQHWWTPFWPTNSKEQSPWEASRKILIFMEPNVHYRVRKSPPLVPIMSQINSVHILNHMSLRTILILSSPTPWSSTWSLRLRGFNQNFVRISVNATCLANLIVNNI